MAKIDQKITTMHDALVTLESGLALFAEYEALTEKELTDKNELIYLSARDSIIQRFEYCTDLLWKLLKVYLEEVEEVNLEAYSPKSIIRDSVQSNIITEKEGTRESISTNRLSTNNRQ